MILTEKAQQFIIYSIIFLLLGATLTQSKMFLSPSAFSYYGYHIIGGILLAVAGWCIFSIQGAIVIKNVIPIALFALYTLFNVVNSQGLFPYANIALVAHLLLFLNYLLLFSSFRLDFLSVVRIFCIITLLEGSLCIAQFFDLFSLQGKTFKVHGSLSNPNYIAIFLAMLSPSLCYAYKEEKGNWRFVALASIMFSVISLILLQCRTAFIGVFVTVIYLQGVQNNWKQLVLERIKQFSMLKRVLIAAALFLLFSISVIGLYQLKKDSTEGRLLIAKLALQLGMEKPILGHGLGAFEQKYNLTQAAYFERGGASEKEIFTASHVKTPYIEYLLIFIEGGIVGFALFMALLLLFLVPKFLEKQKNKQFQAAYAGVLAFSVMALSNFMFAITAVIAVFVIYAAFLSSFEARFSKSVVLQRSHILLLAIVLFFIGGTFSIYQGQMAYAFRNVKKASTMIKKEKYEEAIQLLDNQKEQLYFSDQWLINYGWAFQCVGNYQSALEKYEIAERYTSDPELFMDMSFCYARQNNFDKAIQKCSTAMYIAPNRIYPRYGMMNIFLSMKDTTNAEKVAREILALTPKGISKDAARYKKEAADLLNTLKH
jgi:O-antigen polymerase